MNDLMTTLDRFKIYNQHMEKLVDAIGEHQLRFKPAPESNSAAWVLVHLISNYQEFLRLTQNNDSEIDNILKLSEEELANMPLNQSFLLFDNLRQEFYQAIERISSEEKLDHIAPAGEDKTWRDLVYSVIIHEVYHCGQLAYIAKIIQQKAKTED